MKVTKNVIANLVKCLKYNSGLSTFNVRVEEDSEIIIRYEDLNLVTHSIYFTSEECITGYIINDNYKWFSSKKLSAYSNISMFLFDIALSLRAQYEFVERYVL